MSRNWSHLTLIQLPLHCVIRLHLSKQFYLTLYFAVYGIKVKQTVNSQTEVNLDMTHSYICRRCKGKMLKMLRNSNHFLNSNYCSDTVWTCFLVSQLQFNRTTEPFLQLNIWRADLMIIMFFVIWSSVLSLRPHTFSALFSNFLSSSHIQFSVFLLSNINENASGQTHGHVIPTPHPSRPVTTGMGKWFYAHSGNGCGSLSRVVLNVILHSSSTEILSGVFQSLFVLKGAKLS